MIINNKISVCLFVKDNSKHLKNCLKHVKSFDPFELICIVDKEDYEIKKFLSKNYNRDNISFDYRNENSNLIEKINGDYVLFIDSDDWFSDEIENSIRYMINNDLDICINSNKGNYLKINYNSYHEDNKTYNVFYKKTIFEIPPSINNCYKSIFLKENNIKIPFGTDSLNNLKFHFHTLLIAKKIGFSEEYFIEKRYSNNHPINELSISNFNNKTDNLEKSFDTKLFFKNIEFIIDSFIKHGFYENSKYHLLNYIFNLLRNIFKTFNDNCDYYSELKRFVDRFSKSFNTDIIINLTTDNLNFYRNVLKSNVLSELNLLYDYQKLELEKKKLDFKLHDVTSKTKAYLTGRLDVKNIGNSSNSVEIFDVDDDNASITYPTWLKDKNGSGAVIESTAGNIDFKVKCHGDGNVIFKLRGVDNRDKQRRRLPIFIDFTYFSINGKKIIDKNILVYHDKPYGHTLKTKNNEIIHVQAKWKIMNNQSDYNSSYCPSHLKPFTTGRFDIKNTGNTKNSVEIFDVTDFGARILYPTWLKDKNGSGAVIESAAGNIDFKVKCHGDGNVIFKLRGVDNRDKQRRRLPIFIDFTYFSINGKKIIDKNILVYHDKPYGHTLKTKNNEIIHVQAKWKIMNNQSDYNSSYCPSHLKPFTTGRFDIKNTGNTKNSVEIFDVTDFGARILYPTWLKDKNGSGAVIESAAGNIDFKVKCHGDGTIILKLKGRDYQNKNGYKLPIYVDFTSVSINGDEILTKRTPVHCKKPFEYKFDIKNNVVLNIHGEWEPINFNTDLNIT